MEIEIRNARAEDAAMVAWIVLAALDMMDDASGELVERMTQVCGEAGTLYSWENTRLAVVDGKVGGGLIAYPGSEYARLRAVTWTRCWDMAPEVLSTVGMECGDGEFYLDSMALLPEFRGLGLGRMLLEDAMEKAAGMGLASTSLIADVNKPSLVSHYEKIGFTKEGTMEFFGHDYFIMRRNSRIRK